MKLALLACFVSVGVAQTLQPNVVNARLETRPYSGDLASQLRASSPTWFGYAARSAHRRDEGCWQCCSQARSEHAQPVQLEGTDQIAILLRVDHDSVERLRVTSFNCSMDAGGLPFIWLTDVPASASLSLLRQLAAANGSEPARDAAIFAISQHAGAGAITMLEQLARPPQPPHLRGQALFWLAQRAGERASTIITGAIDNDPDTEVKKKAVFALSQLPKDESIPKLIEIARQNKNREVQKQAFFWLGQSGDPRALAFFEQVLAQ